MLARFSALYIEEHEFKNILDINQRFIPGYSAHLQITVHHHYNEDSFEGSILNNGQYISKSQESSSGIMQDYYLQKLTAFTFDGIRFFKIVKTAVPVEWNGVILFTFHFISKPTFTVKNTAFMIMPFKYSYLNEFYQRHIKEYLNDSDLKLKVYRADEITGTDVIANTIKQEIQKAEFIICDITNCNKNVFFEVGYADGINKSIIFIMEHQKPDEFFDVSHIRRVEYDLEKGDIFEDKLKKTIVSVRNNRAQ